MNIEDIQLETQSVVSVDNLVSSENDNVTIFPNPTSNTINLRYRIETAGMVNIFITDILGNQTLLKSENRFP
ncbi:MAG: hypothetical protein Q7J05_09810, partial [Paludibacter sp.]|nr:hypothetical protein [Paludibacter sp.]